MAKVVKKTAPKKKSEAVSGSVVRQIPHPDTEKLDALHKHIQERIADGGATTDHLKHMLTMIRPEPVADEVQRLTM